ncbi:MAG: A/G-specific adenine glycosylase [Chloroflexota bacterium]
MDTFSKELIAWYRHNKRDLPWRVNPNGYGVWVSEIMLQQTRVETVIPYYESWMPRFPSVKALAEASQQEVLSMWEGLGYYSRARNLRKAAQQLVERHGAELPQDVTSLQTLPGIGRYTAGAIASMAFGMDEPVVDGNVKRVLARLFDVEESVDDANGQNRIWELARKYLPTGQASEYNQGLMDLGARICTPRNPKCDECPITKHCQAYQIGNQDQRPVRNAKPKIPTKYLAAAVVVEGQNVWLRQRPEKGLLGGMWEFPNIQVEETNHLQNQFEDGFKDELGTNLKRVSEVGIFKHAYTHFRVNVHAVRYSISRKASEIHEAKRGQWVSLEELEKYPMGKVDRQISQQIMELSQPGG